MSFDSALEGFNASRREFLHHLVTGSTFTEPAVASFTMSGISRAYAGLVTSGHHRIDDEED